jgi:hypothetical protein
MTYVAFVEETIHLAQGVQMMRHAITAQEIQLMTEAVCSETV